MAHNNEICQHLTTVRDYIRWGLSEFNRAGLFFGHGTDNALDEARLLVLHALELPFDSPDAFLDATLLPSEREHIVQLLQRRVEERLPAAYLTHEAWFAGLSFYVDERLASEPQRILDLCTGSACIGIACAYAFDDAEVDVADISGDALDVAGINIARHELGHRVKAIHSDVFSGLQGQRYSLIVSNPPYVDARDLAEMPAEYHREPALGLASGEDGLDLTRRILRDAADHLEEGGLLVIEVGNSWVALEQAYPTLPFTWLEFERGGHGVFALTREQLVEAADSL